MSTDTQPRLPISAAAMIFAEMGSVMNVKPLFLKPLASLLSFPLCRAPYVYQRETDSFSPVVGITLTKNQLSVEHMNPEVQSKLDFTFRCTIDLPIGAGPDPERNLESWVQYLCQQEVLAGNPVPPLFHCLLSFESLRSYNRMNYRSNFKEFPDEETEMFGADVKYILENACVTTALASYAQDIAPALLSPHCEDDTRKKLIEEVKRRYLTQHVRLLKYQSS